MALQATLEGGASDFNCNYLNIWHCRVGQTNVQDGAGDFHYIHKLHFRVGQANLQGGAGFRARSMYCILLYFIVFENTAFHFRASHFI
jgi:hypothetical protein